MLRRGVSRWRWWVIVVVVLVCYDDGAQKKTASSLLTWLHRQRLPANAIHGDRTQLEREHALSDFKHGRVRILVATAVAARGLDVPDVKHVINFDLPTSIDDYVHRIGRTGRAGATGVSISFASEDDAFLLPDIEALLGHSLACTAPPTPGDNA